MPKLKNLAALAAAIEAARRYARSNPDKATQYLDQAAAFLDKQTKGRYSTKIDGVAKQVKSAAGLPASGNGTQSYVTNAGYGRHEGYGASAVAPDPMTTTAPSTTPPSAAGAGPTSTTSSRITPGSTSVDPLGTGDRHFPDSKNL